VCFGWPVRASKMARAVAWAPLLYSVSGSANASAWPSESRLYATRFPAVACLQHT
jgi:hypothetical protein